MLIFTEFHGFSGQLFMTFEQNHGELHHRLAAKVWMIQHYLCIVFLSPSVLNPSAFWLCWLDGRKSIQTAKKLVVRYCRGNLAGVRCKWFAYSPADATATPSFLASLNSRMVCLSAAGLSGLSWKHTHTHTHTHTQSFYCSCGICPGPLGWAVTRKVKPGRLKPIWIYWSKR